MEELSNVTRLIVSIEALTTIVQKLCDRLDGQVTQLERVEVCTEKLVEALEAVALEDTSPEGSEAEEDDIEEDAIRGKDTTEDIEDAPAR